MQVGMPKESEMESGMECVVVRAMRWGVWAHVVKVEVLRCCTVRDCLVMGSMGGGVVFTGRCEMCELEGGRDIVRIVAARWVDWAHVGWCALGSAWVCVASQRARC